LHSAILAQVAVCFMGTFKYHMTLREKGKGCSNR